MKTFTTSIFVPSQNKHQLTAIALSSMTSKVRNRSIMISDDLGVGGLDELGPDEQFILIVNGEKEKHHLKMKACRSASGKPRLMFEEPELPEVHRFLQWRVDTNKIMSQRQGAKLQLKNFTTDDLRRLIRTAHANHERNLVNYR